MSDEMDDGYYDEYADNIVAYFRGYMEKVEADETVSLPMIEDWAEKIDKTMVDLRVWGENHPEFAIAMDRAHQIMVSILVKQALSGKFNASFSNMAAKNLLGWKDKQDIEAKGDIIVHIIDEFNGGKPVADSGTVVKMDGETVKNEQ